MIEVLFGESECGGMKVAKNYWKPDFHNGGIGWIGKKPTKEELIYTSWGEIAAGKFYKFLPLEKELTCCEIKSFAYIWAELKEEKSTLRAVVNGKLIGVPEDFYDHIIRKEIPDGEFIMARLIGNILGKHPLGVGDWWFAKRIKNMIENGELIVVQKKKEIYSQVLKKV